jgi:hypothetical protein
MAPWCWSSERRRGSRRRCLLSAEGREQHVSSADPALWGTQIFGGHRSPGGISRRSTAAPLGTVHQSGSPRIAPKPRRQPALPRLTRSLTWLEPFCSVNRIRLRGGMGPRARGGWACEGKGVSAGVPRDGRGSVFLRAGACSSTGDCRPSILFSLLFQPDLLQQGA